MSRFYTQTIHSDILVHWTGKDFDPEVKDDFYSNDALNHPSKITDNVLIDKYLTRLRNILLYGFWIVDIIEASLGQRTNPCRNYRQSRYFEVFNKYKNEEE